MCVPPDSSAWAKQKGDHLWKVALYVDLRSSIMRHGAYVAHILDSYPFFPEKSNVIDAQDKRKSLWEGVREATQEVWVQPPPSLLHFKTRIYA